MKKIVENKIRCKLCGDIVESKIFYDYTYCKCGMVGVIGGNKYIERVGLKSNYEELSTFAEKTEQDLLQDFLCQVENILFSLMAHRMHLQNALDNNKLEISRKYLNLLYDADGAIEDLAASLYWLNDEINNSEDTEFMMDFKRFLEKRKKW